MGNPPEGGRSKSTFCSISLLWQGISGCMCHRMHQKNLPCDSVCTRHKHVQSRVWADAEGSSILGRCFTDHPVKHCAVLVKMVIIIKNVFGRYKRERLGTTCLSRAKVAFQILLNAQGGIYLQQHQEVTHQGNMK